MKQKLTACVDKSSGWESPITLVASTLDPRKKDAGIPTVIEKETLRKFVRDILLKCDPQN